MKYHARRVPAPRLHTRAFAPGGFTLVELLVVIGIIALLIGILMPVLSSARKAAQRTACLSNERQIVMAALLHAHDNKKGIYIPTFGSGNDNLAQLWQFGYLKNPQVAICPGTQNVVRMDVLMPATKAKARFGDTNIPMDLTHGAPLGAQDPSGGISYEIWAWYPCNIKFPNGILFMDNQLDPPWVQRGVRPGQAGWGWGAWSATNVKKHFVLKTNRNVRRPQECILVIDGDQDGNKKGHNNNWPDPNNNHDDKGFNVGFADGHASFVKRGGQLVDAYLASGNANPNVLSKFVISQRPGLSWSSTSIAGRPAKVWEIK